MPRELSRVERWEQTSEVPLLLFAAAFLVAYAWPILDPNLHPDLETFFFYASWTVWLAFTIDFLIRLWLADRRGSYALRHWYDVVLIAAPAFRPLRLLRLLAFARILNRSAVGGLTGRVAVYVAGAAVFAVSLGALAIRDAERDAPGANITTAGDALWWASTTVTTVGYGDRSPGDHPGSFHRRGTDARRDLARRITDRSDRQLDDQARRDAEDLVQSAQSVENHPAASSRWAVPC